MAHHEVWGCLYLRLLLRICFPTKLGCLLYPVAHPLVMGVLPLSKLEIMLLLATHPLASSPC